MNPNVCSAGWLHRVGVRYAHHQPTRWLLKGVVVQQNGDGEWIYSIPSV